MITENFAGMIAWNVRRRAERIALAETQRSLTYAELGVELDRTAGFLQARGVRRGETVGLTMRDGIDHVVVMVAIVRLGAILLPMDSRWTIIEKTNVARFFVADHVVTDDAGLALEGTAVVLWTREEAANSPAPIYPADFRSDEPMVLSLSSGTTGTPKGPLLTHRQMMLRVWSEWVCIGFTADDVNLCATPLYFGGGRNFTLSYLAAGATVAFCPPPYRPADVASAIDQFGVTTTFLVPTLLRRVLEAPDDIRAVVRRIRMLISSGSALHPAERADMAERVNANIVNYYASTESGGISILPASVGGVRAGSVGLGIIGSEISIADESGKLCAPGEFGHIRQRAPWHPAGFHRNESETKRYFREGWYLPGDLGYLDEGGYLFITGRSKDMIIRGGVNIYPNEIEAALIAHPAVQDAAVVGRPSPLMGEEITAFVVPAGGADDGLALADLVEHCRERLAPYKIPSEFRFIDVLPRNSGGKVLKAELLARTNSV
jgi:long-chain acyl-CoA synthetase